MTHKKTMESKPEILLFGPEITKWSPGTFSALQAALYESGSEFKYLRQALVDLPDLWPELQAKLGPAALPSTGLQELEKLRAFGSGGALLDPDSLSVICLATLTVVYHGIEFHRLGRNGTTDPSRPLAGFDGVQGFCVGFLSAAAAAASATWAEYQRNLTAALRIAACIGMAVELEDQTHEHHEKSASLSIRCKVPVDTANSQVKELLAEFPTAYIACITDETSLTVTLPRREISAFSDHAKSMGILTYDIQMSGAFHHARHAETAHQIGNYLASRPGLHFICNADELQLPLRSNENGQEISTTSLTDVAVESILCKTANWFEVVKSTIKALPAQDYKFTTVGKGSFVPSSLLQQKHALPPANAERHVAIVGMACRFPNSDNVTEFWELLKSGATALSKLPVERFDPSKIRRQPSIAHIKGNFIREPDVFDHRFFGVSGREAKSTDPQQRLALQVAYEALESSGYYSQPVEQRSLDVGCYVGVAASDWEENVASEDANAFSLTGTSRAFVSGKISHFFGWSGPSISFDTACSSSAVAIHTACKALIAGECSAALAGGVNVMTGPLMFQNLAAASFINPEGSSRAFDESANGYCRGEGAGMLVLKRLSDAVAQEDLILGVITGSAVNQGANSSPITVPHSASQSSLYRTALASGGVSSEEVSYVEAHGTGTPVGDPIEYESVRTTFCGRRGVGQELFIGSVKDNIGHAEAASGVAAVIKCLLMMQHSVIPKQAGFKKLNHRITSHPSDRLVVPMRTEPWSNDKKVAVVNNYGAAGSNAALVIRRHAPGNVGLSNRNIAREVAGCQPILVAAKSATSLASWLTALKPYAQKASSLSDFAINVARRQNRTFSYRAAFFASDLEQLALELETQIAAVKTTVPKPVQRSPVILCFGGQTGRSACLSKDLFNASKVLQKHLADCDSACRSLGLPSIFPGLFESEEIDDLVVLHSTLFAIQYSTAKCWLDSGLEVDTLIGHSFGQLTALCVADALSLRDALYLVTERSRLVQEKWLGDSGSMLAVEGEQQVVKIIASLSALEIACYNGPRSFVLSGATEAVNDAERECAKRQLKATRLKNSHAYHSRLTDSLLPEYSKVARSIVTKTPRIRVETCSEGMEWPEVTAEAICQHTREPVYFLDAVKRIASRVGPANWVEAGSASPIIPMARRALGDELASGNTFFPLNLSTPDAVANLSEVTCSLWRSGSQISHWIHLRGHTDTFNYVELPPYQFDKPRHWTNYRPRESQPPADASHKSTSPHLQTLITKLPPDGQQEKDGILFSIDKGHPIFELATRGHAVVNQSLCPASMYIELVARCAIANLGAASDGMLPQIEDLAMSAPIGLSRDRHLFVRLSSPYPQRGQPRGFSLFSRAGSDARETLHASGRIYLVPTDDHILTARLLLAKRLIRDWQADRIQSSPQTAQISGKMIYKVFSEVVDYAPYYHGVRSISALWNEAVGVVTIPTAKSASSEFGVCDPTTVDNFTQVAGLHINSMSDRPNGIVFMCTAIEEISFAPGFMTNKSPDRVWSVYTKYEVDSKGNKVSDIFATDSQTGDLVVVILAATFKGVPIKSLARHLGSLAEDKAQVVKARAVYTPPLSPDSGSQSPSPERSDDDDDGFITTPQTSEATTETETALGKLQTMLCELLEVAPHEVKTSSTLDDLGVDSLLVTEVLSEIHKWFGVAISPTQLQNVKDVSSLARLINPKEAAPRQGAMNIRKQPEKASTETSTTNDSFAVMAQKLFTSGRTTFGQCADEAGLTNFCTNFLPQQTQLGVVYIVEAFDKLGCRLKDVKEGDQIPIILYASRHEKLVSQIYGILKDYGILSQEGDGSWYRTQVPIPARPARVLYEELLHEHPRHASETQLLGRTGPHLAECLSGKLDPVSLIFQDATSRSLLEDVYTNAPIFQVGTILLTEYLTNVMRETMGIGRKLRILELGAGTGGTTRYLVERLASVGADLEYTFTDLSPSLVAQAKKKFRQYPFMKYAPVDIEKEPESPHAGAYDIVISTNCIHATKDLVKSTTNIRKLLRPDGLVCLVELNRTIPWLDLIFGLLEGWWLFEDGRQHALADEKLWGETFRAAGYHYYAYSDGPEEESGLLRVLVASPASVMEKETASANGEKYDEELERLETVSFKKVDDLDLCADIYYPPGRVPAGKTLPVALMIHGGGHIMLSRKDVRPEQTALLLQQGFLPISVDYRLCPEVDLASGAMVDVADAMAWIRQKLPAQRLKRRDIRVDGTKVVSVGWSTGGFLALSLGWTTLLRGIQPPDATLAFYSPSDYEDPFWTTTNIPNHSDDDLVRLASTIDKSVWEGVFERPVLGYNVPAKLRTVDGWMAAEDARSRIALYMNWRGRTLHVLLNGMNKATKKEAPEPSRSQIEAVSILSHARKGMYRTPTFLVHPYKDDLIPWQQALRTHEVLREAGVDCELRLVEDVGHLFDLRRTYERHQGARDAIRDGYEFLRRFI
ncbi:hypothetical protein F4824DRAFT_493237 [Ustulina deusta]|nr:hypothetical protein F4824DRAFT_493237 [Ustulina deusta]